MADLTVRQGNPVADAGGGALPQPAGRATPAFRASDLGMTFQTARGAFEVLRSVDFEVGAGEIVAIVGRSGTGKTTLLRVLGGLIKPTSGLVDLHGVPVHQAGNRAITVFQDYTNALLPWRSVVRNVGLGLEGRVSRAERESRVQEALQLVHLEKFAKEYPARLSGGMQQRVQIARALAMHPEVLLMDEPFGALDALTKTALQDELLRVQARTGATIVFITHDIEEAIYLSDRVFVINGAPGEGQPGTLSHQAATGLPRPRNQITTRQMPEYLALRERLLGALHVVEAEI